MAARRLSPEERALWQRVAGSVRALKPAAAQIPGQPLIRSPEPVEGRSNARTVLRQAQDYGAPVNKKQPVVTNTLDGSWDKRIGAGRIMPERTIDLHGYTAAAAHHRLERGLEEAIRDGVRVILLVTGRAPRRDSSRIDLPLRGIIRSSVDDWLAASRHTRAIAAVRHAHPRHGGAGALYIVLRRPR